MKSQMEENKTTCAARHLACIADWDGTLRPDYLIRSWLLFCSMKFGISPIASMKFNELLLEFSRNNISYSDLVLETANTYAMSMKDLSVTAVEAAASEFVEKDAQNLFSFVPQLIRKLQIHKIRIFIVSGAPAVPLRAYQKLLGIDGIYAVELGTSDQARYNGSVNVNYGIADMKRRAAREISENYDVLISLGDTASDTPLFSVSRHSILISHNQGTNNDLGESLIANVDEVNSLIDKILVDNSASD